MKDWSITKKILVGLTILILAALIISGIKAYYNSKKDADKVRVKNRIAQLVEDKKIIDNITGDKLVASIRENLANQPISSIGVQFYQPSIQS